jgi:6-phospho-3-hexuloisomerase
MTSARDQSPKSEALLAVAELETAIGTLSDPELREMVGRLVAAKRVFVAGGGRSGLMARAVAMRLVHVGLEIYVVGETNTPGVGPDDLFWAFSARGTGEGLNTQARGAKTAGATVAACLADRTSPLAETADFVIEIPVGSDGVASAQHAGSLRTAVSRRR